MVLGDYTKLVNAQNVTFKKGTDEAVTLYNIRLSDESVIDRRNARGGPIDTPTFSIVEVIADCVLSEDLYTAFRAMRVLTSRGALPTATYAIVATAISASADDWTETGTFILRKMEDIALEKGRYEVTLTLRLQGTMTQT